MVLICLLPCGAHLLCAKLAFARFEKMTKRLLNGAGLDCLFLARQGHLNHY